MKGSSIRAAVFEHHWKGAGTVEDPYVVEWLLEDPENPLNFSQAKKWFLTLTVSLSCFCVTFLSSAFSGSIEQIRHEFNSSQEVTVLGISVYVLGFALGPAFWAPLSELYGRRILFWTTFGCLTACTAGCAGSNSVTTLVIMRLLSGTFGASPMTNAGGVIADLFPASQRGLALAVFATAPFLGPTLGPVMSGFSSETIGWRWVQGILAIFTGLVWIFGTIVLPESYAPILLQQRAKSLSKKTGKVFISVVDKHHHKTAAETFKRAVVRPWVLLFREPIVLISSIYMAIMYGTVYMLFGAYPIIYQQGRGWSDGIGGLAFLGMICGLIFGLIYMIIDNSRYNRILKARSDGYPPAESRLPPCIVGSLALPIGLFWFSWTNGPAVPWIVSIIASAPFGFGIALVFIGIMNYLIDTYTIYAASVLAAGAMLRALFGAAFPLFTTQMYANLGIHWASSIPAFLTLLCLPFPPVMYFYGEKLRLRCRYAKEAAEVLESLKASSVPKAG